MIQGFFHWSLAKQAWRNAAAGLFGKWSDPLLAGVAGGR